MIPCKCINDKKRPAEISPDKWVKEGDEYHITFVARCLPQNLLSYSLYEKPLDESCYPYEYFISTRFAIAKEHIEELIQLCYSCKEFDGVDVQELVENSNLQLI